MLNFIIGFFASVIFCVAMIVVACKFTPLGDWVRNRPKAILAIIVVVLIISIGFGVSSIGDGTNTSSKNYEEYDDVMAGYDWGDDYYYDTKDHEVKKKPWK